MYVLDWKSVHCLARALSINSSVMTRLSDNLLDNSLMAVNCWYFIHSLWQSAEQQNINIKIQSVLRSDSGST